MHTAPTRRSLLKASAGLLAAQTWPFGVGAAEPPHDVTYAEDFDELWRTLGERYCYFGEKQTDWAAVRALYRPQALAAGSRDDFATIVDRVLGELYDAHTHRGDAADGTARLPYYDLWVEPRNGNALVTSVRDGSASADAGIVAGDTITGVDGIPVAARAEASMPRCLSHPDPAATAFAFNIAVAGRRGQPRRITLRSAKSGERAVFLPLKNMPRLPDVENRLLPDGYGYIVIRSFSDQAVIDAFDAALLRYREAPGLIIDVRQNGGGDTAVARPIMGRFIAMEKPYARMRRRDGDHLSDPWTEVVDPRGPFTYTAPVVVLTTRWSASMAEGFPMGMRGIRRASIVGTPMMRLGAGVFPLHLDRTGIQLQYSAEPVYDVHDRARSLLVPDVLVSPTDDALAAGIRTLDMKRKASS
ncbi:S41 family peptidase [Sphingomonas sp. CFBP 13733]|uniref:S41 family peptidase n=1 Tax=Sphingomonas sp. CFBP 13733 TaxID=2775291 RepID=UPI00177CD955|nr:S41 family peptidase [Sphingomonas sp. CFBP 13733]MBD8638681.1 peptidase S41 [Sphingomonas sp. CFBP 13733]